MENPVPREYAHYAANFQRFVRAEPPLEGSETERKQPDDLPLFTGIIEVDPLEGSETMSNPHAYTSLTISSQDPLRPIPVTLKKNIVIRDLLFGNRISLATKVHRVKKCFNIIHDLPRDSSDGCSSDR